MRSVKRHWPLGIVAVIGLVLVFTNLGSDYLWEDEGDTAVLASNILKFGVPKAWDGVTFTDSDSGSRVNNNLIMVSHPWVEYYVAAASFLVFGENTSAARLPFALAGWMTIFFVYALAWRMTENRWTAIAAALLMVLSVQFLLYARQCRHYSLNILLSCWLLWIFLRMNSWRTCLLFGLAAVLLFHTHPFAIVAVGVLGVLTLVYPSLAPQRRWFWLASPGILLFTVPWLALARSGYAEQSETVHSAGQFFGRFAQYIIECASVTPLLGITFLLLICAMRSKKFLTKNERDFLIVTFALLLSYGLALALTQSSNTLWIIGIRYTPALLPLMAIVAAVLITKLSREQTAIWLALLGVFGFTNLARLTPWIPGENRLPAPTEEESVNGHAPAKISDRLLRTGQFYFLRDLWRENRGTLAQTCEFLRQVARPGERLVTNYDWDPLYFHTRLPQAYKILRDYPIYRAARRQGLPDYVFSVDNVRWVVWRPAWEEYQDYRWRDVEGAILAGGGQLTKVAELNDTYWENRENIHFRRFSDGKYLFPFLNKLPPASIFRVDWPGKVKTAP